MQQFTCDIQPLSENESLFKQMYQRYPELKLEQPRSLEELDAVTAMLPEYHQIHRSNPTEFPISSVFDETEFQEHISVATRFHERYSPCFLHEHSFFEIIYVIRGTCINHLFTKPQVYQEGDICILAPHTRHALSVFDDDSIVLNILLRSTTFQQTFFSALQNKGVLSDFFARALLASSQPSYLYFHSGTDEILLKLVREIVKETCGTRRYAEGISNSLVTLFFLYLLRRHENELEIPNPTGRENEGNIMFIINYLMQHYRTITQAELASFFNYSERQMTRLLKDYTGKNFTDFVRSIRLEKACEMLKTTDIPIPDIIDAVGYSNNTHFYTLFKKEYGKTPAAYREENR